MSSTRLTVAKTSPAEASTRQRLLEAAAREFNTVGFHGSNTNRIARAAGFAPQTFYRNFEDKVDIFVAMYEMWQAEERAAVARTMKSAASNSAIARTVLDHHVAWATFRRSLRLVAIEESAVREARRLSRQRQIDALERVQSNAGRSRVEIFGALLAVERLCDAAADGELSDLGIGASDTVSLIAGAIRTLRGEKKK